MDEIILLETLKDPLRLAIFFQILKTGEITAKEIEKNLNIPRNTIYYHLKKLKKAGIIVYREEPIPQKHFPQRVYRISDEFIAFKQNQYKDTKKKSVISKRLILIANLYEASAFIMEAVTSLRRETDGSFENTLRRSPMVAETYLLKEIEYQEAFGRLQELFQDLQAYSEANAQQLFGSQEELTKNHPPFHFLSVIGVPPLSR